MAIQKGDIIDEAINHEKSCRIAVRVLEGGGGFTKIDCCGFELTEADKTDSFDGSIDRFAGDKAKPGVIIDESKNYPNACGLKVEFVGGGNGFSSITCCGNELTIDNDAA